MKPVAELKPVRLGGFLTWSEQTRGVLLSAGEHPDTNSRCHEATTGEEIWEQAETSGGLDAFVCAAGTGGELAGMTH